MSDRIRIFDTTLRDGEQAPGFSLTVDQKLRMARQLERLGVDVIEAGFPIASQGDFEAVRQIAGNITESAVAGLCRTIRGDIDRAWEAVRRAKSPRIHTFVATSDIHLEHKLCKGREEVLDMAVEAVRYARTLCDDVEFSAEDAVRSDVAYLCRVLEAVIGAGANVVNIPDTVGYSVPDEFGGLIRTVMERVPNIRNATVSVHCHNDLGLAVANSMAAVRNGARQVECTVNGIGERAGNASLEELVMILHTRKDMFDFATGVQTPELYPSSRLLTRLTGEPVQRNKAIVGKNAFAHEAGIHQHGVMKDARTYEIMTPERVGVPNSRLVLGKHSGRHALQKRYRELGVGLTEESLNKAYRAFTELADKKKVIYDADLMAIVEDELSVVPEAYHLEGLQVISGSTTTPTATLRLRNGKQVLEDSSVGDGPVDAACRAVDRITGKQGKLLRYSLNAITEGKDALGEVFLQVEIDGAPFSGRGTSTDVVEASVRAYVHAVNRAEHEKRIESGEGSS